MCLLSNKKTCMFHCYLNNCNKIFYYDYNYIVYSDNENIAGRFSNAKNP